MELQGKYGTAKIYTDIVEQTAILQIVELLNQPFADDANVRIMPDVHAGKGCVIGTTMRIEDKVCPNLVGVDIGCGVLAIPFHAGKIDFEKLDKVIREQVPSGMNVRETPLKVYLQKIMLSRMYCYHAIQNIDRIIASMGTLGGGNHYIEVGKSVADQDVYYLTIHSGSRNLGVQIAKFYQEKAIKECAQDDNIARVIEKLKNEGREKEISSTLAQLKKERVQIPNDLAYLSGQSAQEYLRDMRLAQLWADDNRNTMAQIILEAMKWEIIDEEDSIIHTVHNYIDLNNILRKGAVSARYGELFILPMNMRDGSLICRGKGNPEWNFSAPHGAGRLMSRAQAKRELSIDDFQNEMSSIYTTSVSAETLDEAPMAYKKKEDIVRFIDETADIVDEIIPVYNFKASEA